MATSLNTSFIDSVASSDKKHRRGSNPYIIGKVTHVVQGPFYYGTTTPDPYYKSPADLGKITYELIQGTQANSLTSAGNPLAKPFNSSLKHYPLEGEIVTILPGPSTDLNINRGEQEYYYLPPYNLWSASHHNAFPDLNNYATFVNKQNQSYQQTANLKQTTNLSVSASVNFPLGPNFLEKSNIKALRIFTGDVTIEGRWGNSVRFGSTSGIKNDNNWSATGSIGNPIIIITNGQGPQLNQEGYIPYIENINTDPTSIYLTNGQEINIVDLKQFSLASLQVDLGSTVSVSMPIQQQLSSTVGLSAMEQDDNINSTSDLI